MDWKPLKGYLILIAIGAALLASVWTVKGWVGNVVGGLGVLLILSGLYAIEGWLQKDLENEAKKTEHEDFEPSELKAIDFEEHPPTQRKIRWFSGVALAICVVAYFLRERLPAPYPFLILVEVVAVGFSSFVIFEASFKSKEKSRSIGWVWKSDEKFRKTVWAFILGLMISPLPLVFSKITLIKSKEFLLFQLPFFLLFLILPIGFAAFLQRNLDFDSRRKSTWKPSEETLDVFFWVTIIIGLASIQPIGGLYFSRLVSELKFVLLFAAVGLGVGWMVFDFIKTHFTNLFSVQSEKRNELQLRIYISSMLATGFFAVIWNHQTAIDNAFYKNYYATEKANEKWIFVEVDGKSKRFDLKAAEWKATSAPDSVKILVGKGILGFDVFLKFEPINQ